MNRLREEEATHRLLQRLDAPPLSDTRYDEILGDWRGEPPAIARNTQVRQAALRAGLRITVPAAVIAEWWRERSDLREDIVASVRVEPLTDAIARLAGEAIARVKGATAIDAIVMASAALRGDLVYTSDVDELELLRAHFRAVRVLGV